MVVSNHPLASAAGAEMLAAGGNAVDAAIATLFALTVVEPMMVGIIGGGMAHIRLADGSHRFIDGQSTVPLAVRPDTYRSKPGSAHDVFDTVGDENLTGPKAVAVPGSLKAWCETLARFGSMPLADVLQPAIKHASRGYAATPYLHECITDGAQEMLKDKAISAIYLPDGTPLKAGERVVQAEYAETLTTIARDGEAALYTGPLGDILVDYMREHGGFIAREDLTIVQNRRARAGPGRLSRLANSWAAAARRLRRAHRADAEYSRGLRHRRKRIRHRRDHPSARRSAEDRLCRSRRRQRRSGFYRRAGGETDIEGLCEGTPRRDRSCARATLERGCQPARKRPHHAHDRGGCDGQRGRDHADHQQSVRRQVPDPRPRRHPEQLHEPVRSPARPCAVA